MEFSNELLEKAPLIAIIRGLESDVIHKIAETLYKAEFYTLEVTMNTAGVCGIISSLRKEFPEMNVGAGTVLNVDDLNRASEAGAQFIVTPVVDEEVIMAAKEKDLAVFPGAFTPTEIYRAWSLGATAVKVFPATQMGARYIAEVLAPLDEVKLIPTGGITVDEVEAYFDAGAYAVGVGPTFMMPEFIETGEWKELEMFFRKFKDCLVR